ncbi:MAG: glycyl-radical enzyme activating protein [Thermodesulfobacteriota bacterium]|jgi:pyruvate formate lyase activating enzyme
MESPLPLIVDVKRNSLEDGPGIRSVVFFKGCPLRCLFCQNPETQDPNVEIVFSARECIRCGECAIVCPQGAIDLGFSGRIHREKCLRCGRCAGICPGKGLRRIGSYYPVEVLTGILLQDLPFYRHSGGGVTLSGGECTMHPDYVESLLKSLREKGIHIALETSGYFEYETFKGKILPYIDLIYYDIKIADPEIHRMYVGKTNRIILDNLFRIARERGIKVYPRVPLIPGITTTMKNLKEIVDILCEAGVEAVSLLPYNPMGMEMFASLGRAKPALPELFMRPDQEREIYAIFTKIIEEKERFGSMAEKSFL